MYAIKHLKPSKSTAAPKATTVGSDLFSPAASYYWTVAHEAGRLFEIHGSLPAIRTTCSFDANKALRDDFVKIGNDLRSAIVAVYVKGNRKEIR